MAMHRGTRSGAGSGMHVPKAFGWIRAVRDFRRTHPAGKVLSAVVAAVLAIVLVIAVGPATAGDVAPATAATSNTPEAAAASGLTDDPAAELVAAEQTELLPPPEDVVGTDDPTDTEDLDSPTPLTPIVAPTKSAALVSISQSSTSSDEATIRVQVGSDRSGNGASAVSNLAGVKLGLWKDSSGSVGTRVASPWGACVSDASGHCDFIVPDTASGGGNRDDRFWVQQVDAGTTGTPAGYFASTELGTATASTDYRFRTGTQLRSGNTYNSGVDFMGSASGVTESSGIWQVSRENPNLPQTCGLDVALVLDLSTSIGGDIGNLKAAADGFVNALTGTPSRIATFSFGSASPASGTSNNPALMSVSSSGAAVKATYSGWSIGTNYTNWDQALNAVASASPHYDAVVVITDGNPTVWGTSPDSTSDTTLREVEYGIFSANLVKSEATRVIAFGVGDGVASAASGLNLRAISGTTKFNGVNASVADYYQVSDFAVAGQALRTLALGTCQGSLTVVKQLVPEGNTGENISGAQIAGGWEMTATPAAPLTLSGSATKATNAGTGAVNYVLGFPGGTASGSVSVTENQQSNHVLVTQGGKNAVCKNVATGAIVAVTNTGTPSNPGFSTTVTSAAPVSCTLYNRHTPQVDVKVEKLWMINGTTYNNGSQPAGITAQLSVSGPGQASPVDRAWGQAYGGYAKNSTTRISETISAPGCTVEGRRVTAANGNAVDFAVGNYYEASLTQDHNIYTLTNTLTCPVKLRVLKQDESGAQLAGASFTFTPDPVTGTGTRTVLDNGPSDADPAPGVVLIDPALPGSYQVEETGAPAGYALPKIRIQSVAANAAGSTGTVTFVDRLLWLAPTVTKTANGTYDAEYLWSITKTVKNGTDGVPGSSTQQRIAEGESAVFTYDITVTQGAQIRRNFRVNGVVTVANPNAGQIRATLGDHLAGATCTFPGTPDLEPGTPGKQIDLAPGSNLYPYTCSFANSPQDQDAGINSANLSWSKADFPQSQADVDATVPGTGAVSGAQAFDFVEDGSTNKTITVTDDQHTFSPDWTLTWSAAGATAVKSYTWSTEGTPGTCETTQTNTATILETGQSATTLASVCVGANLRVTKNAVATLTRSYLWGLSKSADSATLVTAPDGTATAGYSVRVQAKGFDDTNWLMTGEVTVTNPNNWEAVTLTAIQDAYEGTDCTIADADGNLTLAAGQSRVYHYTCVFDTVPSYDGTNTATATWDGSAASTPNASASGTKAVTSAMWTESPVNKSISVYDDWTEPGTQHLIAGPLLWSEDFDQTFEYSIDLTGVAGGTCTDFTNRAWVAGANDAVLDEDTAVVQACHRIGLGVSKTAQGDFTRTFEWSIEKFIDEDKKSQTVFIDGYEHSFDYQVAVTPGGAVDSAWKVSGTITVTNENTDSAIAPILMTGISDTPDIGASAVCSYTAVGSDSLLTFPVSLNSGEKVRADYVCIVDTQPTMPYAGTNSAAATWDASGSASSSPVEVDWNAPTEVDKSIDVFDNMVDSVVATQLGTVDWNEVGTPTVFDYNTLRSVPESDAGRCGTPAVNTAWLGGTAELASDRQDSATAVICPRAGTWEVAKVNTAGDGPISTDTDVTYRLTATKTGGVNPKDVVLSDDLNQIAEYLTGAPSFVVPAGTDVSYDAGVLTWTIEELSGTPRTLDFTVHVKADAYGVELPNLLTSPGSENCPEAESAAEECATENVTPHYTVAKSSDAGAEVMPPYFGAPGTVITYTLQLHNDSDAPINSATLPGETVTDDLTDVLDDATFIDESLTPSGQATRTGEQLDWTLPEIPVDGTVTLSYQVRVNGDRWDQTLINTVTPGAGGDCAGPGACTTIASTPPFTQIQVRKTDAETGESLAGAEFVLNFGEQQIAGPVVSDENGMATFSIKLQPGEYTVQETQAPAGYALPSSGDTITVTVQDPEVPDSNFVAGGPMAAIVFADPAIGIVEVFDKAQFERDPVSLEWVPSDGVVNFGDEVRYQMNLTVAGPKLLHDVTVTDYVPGYDPSDLTTAPAGTKAELVTGSPTCGGGITCAMSADDASGLVTWRLTGAGQADGDVRGDTSGWVAFVVTVPDLPGENPEPGSSFQAALWNQAYLSWFEIALPDDPQQLTSNEVIETATETVPVVLPPVVLPPVVDPPVVVPPVVAPPSFLPDTGGPDRWMIGAGLMLVVWGAALVGADRRRSRRR